LAALLASATFAATAAPASASSTSDLSKQQKAVRSQQKAINGQISTLKASDAQLHKQLDQLDASVRTSKAQFDAAAAAAAAADAAATLARGNEEETTANYNRLRQSTKALAIRLYVHGFAAEQTPKFTAQQLEQAANSGFMGVLAVSRGQDVTQRLGVLRDQMTKEREAADAAAAQAASERAKQQSALNSLTSNRAKQAAVASTVESRLEAALAESASLAQVDKSLSDQIARASKGGGSGSGNISVGNVDTVTVDGITVARSIASKVDALMKKASADGVPLSGWGYRNSDQQIALRKAHCGTTDYDVYDKPSNQCSPPTARPGASMHERGLAIDFTYQGSIITSHSNPAWVWLNKNAKNYGLYNLSSEPWHWSTNGN
jgi:peptidoglycan hydrolase CwlO-like protein